MSEASAAARQFLDYMVQKYAMPAFNAVVPSANAAESEGLTMEDIEAQHGAPAQEPQGLTLEEIEALSPNLMANRGSIADVEPGFVRGAKEIGLGAVQLGRQVLRGAPAEQLRAVEDRLRPQVEHPLQANRDSTAYQVGRFVGQAMPTLPLVAVGGTQAALLPRVGSLAAQGVALGAVQPVYGSDYAGEKTRQMALGAGINAGIGAAGEVLNLPGNLTGKAISSYTGRLLASPEGQAGEQLSRETGIHLTPAAKSGSRFLNLAENAARQSFLTADKALEADKQTARDVGWRLMELAGDAPDKGGIGEVVRDTFRTRFDDILSSRSAQAADDYGRVRDLAGSARMFPYDTTTGELQKIIDETSGVVGADAQKVNAQARDALSKLTKPQATPQVAKINTEVDPQTDDVFIAMRKLGGISKEDFGESWRAWTFKPHPKFGPMWRNAGGRSLDDMAAALQERGYLSWDDPVRELEEIIVEGSKGTLPESQKWARVKTDFEDMYSGPRSQEEDIMDGLSRATDSMNRLSDMFQNRNAAKAKPREGLLGTIDEAMRNRSAWSKATRGDGGLFEGISSDANRTYASRLLGALDKDFDIAGEVPGDIGSALKAANRNYRQSSLEAEAVKKSPLGSRMGKEYKLPSGETEYTVAPEKIIDTLNGLPESQLKQTIDFLHQNNPAALADLERYYIANALKTGQEPIPSQGLNVPELSGARTIRALPGKTSTSDASQIVYRYNPELLGEVQKVEEAIRRWGDKFGYNTSGTAPMSEFLQAINSALGFTLRGASTVGGKFLGLNQVAEAMRSPAGRQAVYDIAVLGPKGRGAAKALSVLSTYAAEQPNAREYKARAKQGGR